MSIAQEPQASAKYEAFLDTRLNQARRQVRWLDIGVGAIGLITLTLAYGLAMLVLDRQLHLPTFVRQISLVGFVAFAVWYAMRVLLTPLRTAVNPYYAAKKVEHVLPRAKNSLVNWLDLRERPLAEPIRDAIGRKAATDLSQANVTEAVRDTRLVRSGAILTLLGVAALILLLALRPPQFFSLLQRAFMPFNSTAIATRTVIKLLEPKDGDVTLSVNQSLFVRAEVDGRNPQAEDADAMRLRLRYQPSDPVWEERKLEATDRPGEWRIQVPAAIVRTGFEYQVVGGDAATPIYRVRVRAKAMITDFEVTYHYRPYLGFADDIRADPNLSAFRGTAVTLLAKTNRPVKEGVLKFVPASGAAHPPQASIPMPDRPDTLKFVLQLDQSGKYRLQFNSADGEASIETLPFDINVLPDLPPRIEVTKPATSPVPSNGHLFISARLSDDFGLTSARMIFRLRSAAGAVPEVLQPVPLRDRPSLTQPDGKLRRQIDVKAGIPLESLKDVIGAKPTWQPGMMLEYAIEAEDNYDNPSPQVGRSPWESVTIGDPASQEEKKKSQAAADQMNKAQEQDQQPRQDGKQDNKGQGENQPRQQDQRQDGQQDNKGQDNNGQGNRQQPQDQSQDGQQDSKGPENQQQPQGGKGDQGQPDKLNQQPANDAGKGEQQQGEQQKGDQQQKDQPPLTPDEKKTLAAAKKLEDALREEQKNNSPSEKREGGKQPIDPNAQPKSDGKDDKQQPKDGKPGDEQSKPEAGDKPESKGQGQERKPGDETDKQGKQPGRGDPNKSNDQDPKTSPDHGKEDGGKGSSERGGERKAGDKADKPDQKGQSGQSDPNVKPNEDSKPNDAKSNGGKPRDDHGKSEPDSGAKDAKPDNRKPDQPGKLEDAPKDMKGGDNKTDAKPDGKSNQPGKPSDANDPEAKPNESDSSQAGSETSRDKNVNAKQQKERADKLQEQAKNAPTQQERDAAKEALKKLDEERANAAKQGQADDKTKPGAQPKAKSNEGQGEKPGDQPGEQRPGEGPAKENPQQDAKEELKPGEGQKIPTDHKEKRSPSAPPKQGHQPDSPAQPGAGQAGADNRGDVTSTSGAGLGAANPNFAHRAGEMQLDTFRNRVDRRVLDRAKMTDQEYQDFLKAYEKLVQKHKEQMPQPGDRVRGDAKGSSAANSGAKKVEAQPGGPKVDRIGRGQAPADIRDQYREFTEQQSKQK